MPGQSRQNTRDLWKPLEQTALDGLNAKSGVLTVDRSDRSQRNLFLSLERMVGYGTVTRVRAAAPYATYRLGGVSEDEAKGVPESQPA